MQHSTLASRHQSVSLHKKCRFDQISAYARYLVCDTHTLRRHGNFQVYSLDYMHGAHFSLDYIHGANFSLDYMHGANLSLDYMHGTNFSTRLYLSTTSVLDYIHGANFSSVWPTKTPPTMKGMNVNKQVPISKHWWTADTFATAKNWCTQTTWSVAMIAKHHWTCTYTRGHKQERMEPFYFRGHYAKRIYHRKLILCPPKIPPGALCRYTSFMNLG